MLVLKDPSSPLAHQVAVCFIFVTTYWVSFGREIRVFFLKQQSSISCFSIDSKWNIKVEVADSSCCCWTSSSTSSGDLIVLIYNMKMLRRLALFYVYLSSFFLNLWPTSGGREISCFQFEQLPCVVFFFVLTHTSFFGDMLNGSTLNGNIDCGFGW